MNDVRRAAAGLWQTDGLTGNVRRVAAALRTLGPSTRAELVAATRLSRPTVTAVLAQLADSGLVTGADPAPPGSGEASPGGPSTGLPSGFGPEAGVDAPSGAGMPAGIGTAPATSTTPTAGTVPTAGTTPTAKAVAGGRAAVPGMPGTFVLGARGGRPAGRVQLTRAAGLVVGVDIGRRHIRVAVADLAHTVLAERDVWLAVDADDTPEPVLDSAAALVDAALREVGGDRREVVGCCLGVPAPVTLNGRIGAPMLLPGWADLDPGAALAERLGVPVHVHNDANLGALGEYHRGAARGCPVLVYVKLATGIGAGIVLDGKLFVGAAGTAGEIGHVSINARGPVCRCGNRGCVELSAGGRALVAHARLSYPDIRDVTELVQRATDGDAGCRRLLSDAASEIGVALSGLVNLINPDRIVLGGQLGGATELLLGPLRRGLTEAAMPAAAATVTVTRGELGRRAAVLGAVISALHTTTT